MNNKKIYTYLALFVPGALTFIYVIGGNQWITTLLICVWDSACDKMVEWVYKENS